MNSSLSASSKNLDPRNLNKFQHFFYDYGRYHNDGVNIGIHLVFVPLIFATLLYMLNYLSKEYFGSDFNYGTLIPILLVPLYVYVDFFLGLITGIQYLLIDYYIRSVTFNLDCISDINIIIIIHIFSWIIQFIGHGVFERRKPALMDNFLLTLNAPIFVNIEIAFFLFRYKADELEEAKKYIVEDIKNFRKSKQN